MNSMKDSEKDLEIEKLTKILSTIQNLYYKKKEQIEELQVEISELKNVLNYLNSMVSSKSFHSADEIYHKALDQINTVPMNELFKEEIQKDKLKGSSIKRKIFSKDNQELLCVLKFIDFNLVIIKFTNPPQNSIRETSEDFINIFLRGALIKIKEKNPDLKLSYKYFKNTDIIEIIEISNLKSINDYDLITSRIKKLLTPQL